MKAYKHIFFDLDHTLWDYERSARETLSDLYHAYGFSQMMDFDVSRFQEQFFRVNYTLWEKYNVGQIDGKFLRENRFRLIFENLGLNPNLVPDGLGEEYVTTCPQKPYVMDGAMEILEFLKQRYVLHIITNGFEDVQWVKLRKSGLDSFFSEVVTSERAGAKKPAVEIFDFSLKVTGALKSESIMIGDNLASDIQGAKRAQIDHVFYNPEKLIHQEKVQREISHLLELKNLL